MYILSISKIDTDNALIAIPRIKSYSGGEGGGSNVRYKSFLLNYC